MGKSKPADLNKSLPPKSNKKAKDTIPTEEPVEPQVPVTKNKTKKESNINPASKKIQKEAVVPEKPNKEKKVAKQEAKKENKVQAAKEAKEVKKVEEETKEEVEQESDGLDVKNFAQIAQAQTEKYNRIRRKIMADVPFDKDQIKEAAKALITYHNASKKPNQLLDTNDDFLYVEIVLSEVPDKHSIRPVQVKLPVPIYGPEYQSRFCVFSRDPQRAYKDKIQDLDIPSIAKVIGYKKLVKKFPQYEDKRKLFHDYDLFFCDYKLYNLLREHTGKIFYEGKKIPFPIDCNDVPEHLKEEYKTYQEYLNSLAQCSYFSMGNGPVYTAKVARVSMSLKDIVKNIIHGIYNTIPYIIKENIQHTKVRQISIKTASSISLPIFNQLTEDELKAFVEVEKPVVSKKDKKAAKKEVAAAPVNGNTTPKQAQKAVEKAAAPQKQAQKAVEKVAAPQKQTQKPVEKAAAPQKKQAAPQKAAPQKGSKKGGKMQVEE